jgi:Rieske 2Fe-2S family protein
MDTRNDMLSRLRNRKAGYSLEQPFYIDPDFIKLDMEHDLVSRLAVHRP